MNTETYTYLLANPQKITSEDLSSLATVIQKYPYFQSARALQLRELKNQESFLYNNALKITAAHTADRDILFEYITSEKFIQNEISQVIQQQDISIDEIEVISENISEQIVEENQLKTEIKKAEAILSPDLFQRSVDSVKELVNPKKESEEIAINKPLDFTKEDSYSFSEWLKLTKANPIDREQDVLKTSEAEIESTETQDRKSALIDKFIQERPRISQSETVQREITNQETKPTLPSFGPSQDSLMTETLAQVYFQQKNYKKAIQAYKILILKNPEKSGFFADQIRAIEKTINSEQS